MVCLFIGDGGLGLWAAVDEVYPEARHQLCWCHKMLNVLDKLPHRVQPAAKPLLRDIYAAPTRSEAEARIRRFADHFERDYPRAVASLLDHQDALLTYYEFPREHWKSLRTSSRSSRSSTRCGCGPERRDGCGAHRQGSTWSFNWCAGPNSGGGESMRPTW